MHKRPVILPYKVKHKGWSMDMENPFFSGPKKVFILWCCFDYFFQTKILHENEVFITPTQGSGFMMVICDRQLVDEVCNQPKGYKATYFYAQANTHPKDYERRKKNGGGGGYERGEEK